MVVDVLDAADGCLRPIEVHALVEQRLGCAVSRDTVTSFLSVASRAKGSPVQRGAYGLYRLAG